MDAPTSYILNSDGNKRYNYGMRKEGVYASIQQIQNDWTNLSESVDKLIYTLAGIGIDFERDGEDDVDAVIDKLIACINENLSETEIESDGRIRAYKMFLRAVVQLSSAYLPVKYEYDSLSRDSRQSQYLSEFQPDTKLTLAALDRLSSYSVQKDADNKAEILQRISDMFASYDETLSAYGEIADGLETEYMLPTGFQRYSGYIEDMADLMT